VPGGAFLFGPTVNVDVPDPVTDVGLNEVLVRFGTPVTVKLTEEVNGPRAVIVTV
jgi:hypothetical protein